MLINTPISVGELIDKMTILEIKRSRIKEDDKLVHIHTELGQLNTIIAEQVVHTDRLGRLIERLRQINAILWDIEDAIRACEKAQDFSDTFIQLARKVYMTNDQRADIKREINTLTNSALHEVKSYEKYA